MIVAILLEKPLFLETMYKNMQINSYGYVLMVLIPLINIKGDRKVLARGEFC